MTDYVDDIYANLRLKEMELAPPVNYMISQEDINEKMRAILVDWLIEVSICEEYNILVDIYYFGMCSRD